MKKVVLLLAFTVMSCFSNGQNLKLISYNIRYDNPNDGENTWPNRKDFLTAQLAFYEPDVFGIQEALHHQVTHIANALSDYNHVGLARDGEQQGEASPIFYKKTRFELVQQNTFWLSETPEKISKGWDAALNRICTYVLLKDKKSKRHFWVFNTHLDHVGALARTHSIQLILNQIKKLNTKNDPVFLMGDFNSKPSDERIIHLKKEMNDSFEISLQKPFGPAGTFNGFRHNQPVTEQIDYIFISKSHTCKVTKCAVLSDSKELKYPSDHLPVYIEVAFY